MEPDQLRRLIATRTPLHNANVLARTVLELIASGEIPPGTRLPTIRDLAGELRMSPSAVAQAWRILADRRVVETHRRGGTIVTGPPSIPRASRLERMLRAGAGMPVDLGNLNYDPALLPDSEAALLAAARMPKLHLLEPELITPELRDAVEPIWPFPAEDFLVVHGGMDGVDLALGTAVKAGDRVMVEEPSFPRLFDIVESVGATPVSIPYGEEGPDLDVLEKALADKPSAFLYQPFGHVPLGRSVTPAWLERAASLLSGSSVTVIEVVIIPFLAESGIPSLGPRLGSQLVQIQNFIFSHGSDCRVAIVGGTHHHVERMWFKITYSSRWVSRILQNALAFHLTDTVSSASVAASAATYRRRHTDFVEALKQRGFEIGSDSGISVWVPVPDEHSVSTRLARKGVSILPGFLFRKQPAAPDHIHVNGGTAAQATEYFADAIADAADFALGSRSRSHRASRQPW
ncbi:aminotransferase class I/II-fold pyridoxal phosphate-dependent enzyme [Streptosporangium saharense]|uniref:aminotransferase class I/II-fold pyridoxal phosphate-dependent enzyme n=1 Tax=Streptosporangium saharense TaxID=1706840 RepID=UPI003414E306